MKDCKKHYKEMYETRLGEAVCPWCRIEELEDALNAANQEIDALCDTLEGEKGV